MGSLFFYAHTAGTIAPEYSNYSICLKDTITMQVEREKVMGARKVYFLSATIAVITSCIVFVFLFDQFLPFAVTPEQFWRIKSNEIQTHKRLWSEKGITKYQIGVQIKMSMLSYPGLTSFDCSQELVVDHNTIVQTIRSTCGSAASLTVDNLFFLIQEKVNSKLCDPEGCKCGPLVVDVIYDSQYFFPKKATTFYDWKAGRTFFMRPGENFCMGIGGNSTHGIKLETYYFKPLK
jgi:hypothetical protein